MQQQLEMRTEPLVSTFPSCSASFAGKPIVTSMVRSCHFDTRVSVSFGSCSSEQSAKAKTQKELFKTLKELKMHLPSEKKSKGKSSTVNTLKYALRCIKQVKGKTCLVCIVFICVFMLYDWCYTYLHTENKLLSHVFTYPYCLGCSQWGVLPDADD